MQSGILNFLLLCIIALVFLGCSSAIKLELRFPNFYSDNMVFQAHPEISRVFGFTNQDSVSVRVMRRCNGIGIEDFNVTGTFDKVVSLPDTWRWEVELPSMENGVECQLKAWQGDVSTPLLDTVYGDVWVCAGTSNIARPLHDAFNASFEAERASAYHNIKLLDLDEVLEDSEQDDFQEQVPWETTANASVVTKFSGLCFHFGKELREILGEDHVIGLVDLTVGASILEAFLPRSAWEPCGIEGPKEEELKCYSPKSKLQKKNKCLSTAWNGMVHPLLHFPIKGAILSIGPNNMVWNVTEHYQCTWKSLFSDWPALWSTSSVERFPIGFELLYTGVGAEDYTEIVTEVTEFRWVQTLGHGVVPNVDLPNGFAVVSLDILDIPRWSHHPRNKQLLAKRFSYGAANAAYHLDQYPISSPYPVDITRSEDRTRLKVDFGQELVFKFEEMTGFYYCCDSNLGTCLTAERYPWKKVALERLSAMPSSGIILIDLIELCFAEEPTVWLGYGYHARPFEFGQESTIYTADEFHLPAMPWRKLV